MQNAIRLPFDGTAKNNNEAATMIGDILKSKRDERIDIIFPVQWAWSRVNILHPVRGVLRILNEDALLSENYNFTGFARYGEIGVTATRC